jgi:hypothetical protein
MAEAVEHAKNHRAAILHGHGNHLAHSGSGLEGGQGAVGRPCAAYMTFLRRTRGVVSGPWNTTILRATESTSRPQPVRCNAGYARTRH